MRPRVHAGILILTHFLSAVLPLIAQDIKAGSPSYAVQQFYKLLHDKRYAEGFRFSIYSLALEGLSAEELNDLEPDFERIASSLPEQVEIRGEQISGDRATVFVKLPQEAQAQEVVLIRVNNQWVIGDRETQTLLKKQGRSYFFNERMRVSEMEVNEWLQEILGAELIYFKAKQRYAPLDELVRLGGVSNQLADGVANGYRFTAAPSADGKSFVATAIPLKYGHTGRLSFYTDHTNLIRAEDKAGQAATAAATPFVPSKY